MSVNPNMRDITFPSDHQYVIIDTSPSLPKYKNLSHIPMVFWIDYSRVGGSQEINDIPALTLLINPNNMSFSLNRKISPTFARDGYIVEEWGEQQDVITCSGKIGGYYITKGSNFNSPANLSGLNRYGRSKSLSFKNIYKLLYIFRNNGAVFQNTQQTRSNDKLIQHAGYPRIVDRVPNSLQNPRNRIDRLGDVYMGYDQTIYIGAFDSFSMKEDANSPYTLEYNFQFTVQKRTTKDHRNFTYYTQAAFENSDVSKNKPEFKTLINSVINTNREADLIDKNK